MDAHIFGLRVFRAHAAERREPESSVRLDLCHHCAQRIRVRLEKQRVFFVRAAESYQHTALGCQLRVKAERGKRLFDPVSRLLRVTGRAVDGKQLARLCRRKLRILSFHIATLLSYFQILRF